MERYGRSFEKNRVRVLTVVVIFVMIILVPVLIWTREVIDLEIEGNFIEIIEIERINGIVQRLCFVEDIEEDMYEIVDEEEMLEIMEYVEREDYFKLSSTYNKKTKTMVSEIENEIEKKMFSFNAVRYSLSITVTTLIVLVINLIGKIMVQLITLTGISGYANIDIPTGVYNKRKCTEMLNSTTFISNEQTNCVLVFCLKNLKKINQCDKLVVYELVSEFARILIQTTRGIYPLPFIGRIKDNTFIVYYEKCSGEETVIEYIEEVKEQVDEFNFKNGGYVIEYNAGYCVNSIEEYLSVIELYGKAELNINMIDYTNTQANKIQEYGEKRPVLEVFPGLADEYREKKSIQEAQIRNIKIWLVIFGVIGVIYILQNIIQNI